MLIAEFFGYLAGIFTGLALIPQVWKSFKTGSTKDISLEWTIIYAIGLILYDVYGWMINSTPLLVTNSVECILAFVLIGLKLKHG